MNKLPIQKRVQIINLLVEGNSLRACSRIADVSINTVTKLLVSVGAACEAFHNQTVVGLSSKKIQADEIWSFAYSKAKNVPVGMEDKAGDVWTWTAIDADSKLIVSWFVGQRNQESGTTFMLDLASRLTNRVQLTTDGFSSYPDAVDVSFDGEVDFAQLQKTYGRSEGANPTERKYSPAVCTGAKKLVVTGNPNQKDISTSYVERQNLTMRMHMRRFTRLTNGFSKKIENHCRAVAFHFVYYNFVKLHKTLNVTPAMAAGLTKRFMSIEDIVRLAER
jgi:IS1 family transposase